MDEFVDRVWKARSDLYAADPHTSLIDADLAGASGEVNAAYNSLPGWAEFKKKVIEAGLGEGTVEAGFDSVLGYAMMNLRDRLRAMRLSADPIDGLEDELFEIMELARLVLLGALAPAKQLRQRWLDELDDRSDAGSPARAKHGRPKDKEVEKRHRKMYEAWRVTPHPSYVEIGRDFRVEPDVARKAITAIHRRLKEQA